MYSPKQNKEKILFNGSFSDGTFCNFIVVNDTQNQWIVGDDIAYKNNTYSAYITSNGVNNNYIGSVVQVSHIYFDVKFPRVLSSADLEFEWRCLGEPKFDYMRVQWADPTITPVAGTSLANKYSIGTSNYKREITTSRGSGTSKNNVIETVYDYQSSPTWRKEYIPLDLSGVRNRKKRFIFSWINSADQNTFNPPIALDNIRVSTITSLENY